MRANAPPDMRPASPAPQPTLRDADALAAAGLIAPHARDAAAAVEARYAVAITPAIRALIHPATRSAASSSPTRRS
jgi:hypothetical protein